MFPQWKPPIVEPAVRCTYALQIVVVRGDGTIHQITREGTSVEHGQAVVERPDGGHPDRTSRGAPADLKDPH
jgi:hypothetical protein